ncbi:hypothetical protein P152DRAFT_461934 [Eremomyces bilateralis CBS 781.70]|uniref:Zn(2)-C6 fungal-type domain-containing protein n=1 Tax=Eremomyces bilateralis CBS 781.70 TaxID=1392243 RepID=A0A6G1FT75_9PEZI|nr:uncharacterized protein P152DRAFT_461934 [Eremomyces bilateralis CBS 781.70]KAF1809075.1 hypothetical protein P152DRAFT_461934 [Eremomyces bilateralis CBS 781.70]
MANIGPIDPRLHDTLDAQDVNFSQPRPQTSRSTSQSHGPSSNQSPGQRSGPLNPTPYEDHDDSSTESPEGVHVGGIGTDPSQPPGEHQKRPRACDSCRQLKVRCAIDPGSGEPCLRCKKAGRTCIVTPPTRKRQKKADNRVAELERKIDALTATLQAQSGNVRDGDSRSGSDNEGRSVDIRTDKRRRVESYTSPDQELRMETATLPNGELVYKMAKSVFGDQPTRKTLDQDTIRSRIDKIVSRELSNRIFERYCQEHMVRFPAVAFPPGTKADDIRYTKPILFLAILNSTSYREEVSVEVQEALRVEMVDVYAVVMWKQGEKSLELVQALLVSSLWYRIPPVFEQHLFYQQIHMAAIMAIDIGLGKRRIQQLDKKWYGDRSPFRKLKPPPESAESRRSWLACYFMCISTTMVLRRPMLLRFNEYMRESIEYLETASDALPSDKIITRHVRLAHIAEEVAVQFSMDDPSASVSVSDAKVTYGIKHFEKDLAEILSKPEESTASQVLEPIIDLYIHEIALHNSDMDDFKIPLNVPESFKGGYSIAGPHHVDALERIQRAAQKELDIFLSLDVETIITLPVISSVRIVYTTVVLIKLYVAATSSGEISQVIHKSELRIESYLLSILQLFQGIHDRNQGIPHGKFYLVIQRLNDRFISLKRSEDPRGHPQSRSGPSEPTPSSHGLQLLSEVAMSGTTHPVGMQGRPLAGLAPVNSDWFAPPGMAGVSSLDPAFQWNNLPTGIDLNDMSMGGMLGSMGLDGILDGGLFAGDPMWSMQDSFATFPGGPWPNPGM